MASSTSIQRTRATAEQLQFYANFLQKHPEIETSKNKILTSKLWEELVQGLNSLHGPKRTVQKWKMTLSTQKSQLRCRARQLKWEQCMNNGGDIDRLDLGTLGVPDEVTEPVNDIERLDLGTLGIPDEELTVEEQSLENPLEMFIKTEDNPIPMAIEEIPSVAVESVGNHLEIPTVIPCPAVNSFPIPSLPQQHKSATKNPLTLENELYNSNSDSDDLSEVGQRNSKRRHINFDMLMSSINNREKRARRREKRQEERDREFIATIKGLTNVIDELITVMKNSSS